MLICKEEGCFGNSHKNGECKCLSEKVLDKNGECKFKKKYQDFPKDYEPTEEEFRKIVERRSRSVYKGKKL